MDSWFSLSLITVGFGTLLAVPLMILVFFGGFSLMGAGMVYSLYGAGKINQGRDSRYIWIGDWVYQRFWGRLIKSCHNINFNDSMLGGYILSNRFSFAFGPIQLDRF